MPSFGENLRREREKRNVTLEQISQSTKIGTRMLQALEDNKFSQLPGGIFNKGFVRAYARTLGIDEEQTIHDYLEASGEAPPVMPEMEQERPAPKVVPEPEAPHRPLPWGMFAALLLLAALALSLWSHRQKKESEFAQSTPQSSGAQSSPATTQPPAERATPPSSAPGVPPSSSNPIAPTTQTTPPPPKLGTVENPAADDAKTASPVHRSGFVVSIQAREDSWTLITADGRTVFTGLMEAGDQRAVRGQKQVFARAGNSGAVDLYFNGKKIPRLGDYGEIRSVTFGPEGATPAPAAHP